MFKTLQRLFNPAKAQADEIARFMHELEDAVTTFVVNRGAVDLGKVNVIVSSPFGVFAQELDREDAMKAIQRSRSLTDEMKDLSRNGLFHGTRNMAAGNYRHNEDSAGLVLAFCDDENAEQLKEGADTFAMTLFATEDGMLWHKCRTLNSWGAKLPG